MIEQYVKEIKKKGRKLPQGFRADPYPAKVAKLDNRLYKTKAERPKQKEKRRSK